MYYIKNTTKNFEINCLTWLVPFLLWQKNLDLD